MRLCSDRPLTRSSHPVLSQSRKIVLSSSPEKAATSDMLRPMSLVISERDFGSPSAVITGPGGGSRWGSDPSETPPARGRRAIGAWPPPVPAERRRPVAAGDGPQRRGAAGAPRGGVVQEAPVRLDEPSRDRESARSPAGAGAGAGPGARAAAGAPPSPPGADRKSTRLNSSHVKISYAVFCLKKKKQRTTLP